MDACLTYRHGSHPGHALGRIANLQDQRNVHCSVCRAASYASEVGWYTCLEQGCNYRLCHKCFEVKEGLFASVQVVIRNPLIPHDQVDATVHTRPRASSHKLAPLYAGKLMEVISSAEGTEDPSQTFFRLRTGGWINSAYVVCVIPAEGFMIEALSRLHMEANNGDLSGAILGQTAFSEMLQEGMRLLSHNPPYGIVMAALTLYPILVTVGQALPGVEEDAEPVASERQLLRLSKRGTFVEDTVCFIHFLMHYVVGELECSLDDGESLESTKFSLYTDVLAGCVLATHDLQQQWRVGLPDEFVPLLMRAATLLGRLFTLLAHLDGGSELVRLRLPAVITNHVDLSSEHRRLRQLCSLMVGTAGRVLLSLDATYNQPVSSLRHMRELLVYAPNEALEKTFCDVLAACMLRRESARRDFFDVDPLEIIHRLSKTATLAESQVTVFRLVGVAARQSPRNIAMMASIVVGPLLNMAKAPRSLAVLSGALDCFRELVFNEPDRNGAAYATPNRLATPSCTHQRYSGHAPFQPVHLFMLPGGMTAALCTSCAAHHPPSGSTLKSTGGRDYAYFRCQCTACPSGGHSQPLPPPSIPPSLAMQTLEAGGLYPLLVKCLRTYGDHAGLLNAVGELLLQLPTPAEVVQALFLALVSQRDLSRVLTAVLAVGVNAFQPMVQEVMRQHAGSPLVRYVEGPYCGTTPMKNLPGDTPASVGLSELGLSPSPHTAYRISRDYNSAGSSQAAVNVNLFASTSMTVGAASEGHVSVVDGGSMLPRVLEQMCGGVNR